MTSCENCGNPLRAKRARYTTFCKACAYDRARARLRGYRRVNPQRSKEAQTGYRRVMYAIKTGKFPI